MQALPCVTDPAITELEVRGAWSRSLGMDVTRRLRETLATRPAAVIVDLHHLLDPEAASLPLWLAARRATSVLRPSVPLALCLPGTTALDRRLQRIGSHRLPIFSTMIEARTTISGRLSLGPAPGGSNPDGRPPAAGRPGRA